MLHSHHAVNVSSLKEKWGICDSCNILHLLERTAEESKTNARVASKLMLLTVQYK